MLYLASASPRRVQLLKEAGIVFRAIRTGYREKDSSRLTPSLLVKKHALGKALAVAGKIRNGKILAADTVVYFGGKIIGKPLNRQAAVKTLLLLQGRWHTVYTAVAFFEMKNGRVFGRRSLVEKTKVLLKKMDEKDIRRYFHHVSPFDKAGSYAIQAKGESIVRKVNGSFSNAVGLPMERLRFL